MDDNFDYEDYILMYDRMYDGGYNKHIFNKNTFISSLNREVPLAYLSAHDALHFDPSYCLGFAVLEDRGDGIVAKCKFANTDLAQLAKEELTTTDHYGLSLYANHITRDGPNIISGYILAVKVIPKASVLVPID